MCHQCMKTVSKAKALLTAKILGLSLTVVVDWIYCRPKLLWPVRHKYFTLDSAGIAQMTHRFRDAVPYVNYKHRSIQEQNYLPIELASDQWFKKPLLFYAFAISSWPIFYIWKNNAPHKNLQYTIRVKLFCFPFLKEFDGHRGLDKSGLIWSTLPLF